MNNVIIHAENLVKIYGKGGGAEVRALDSVWLEIRRGEFVSIMGASGSGKSTLMNILGCLDKPTGGSLYLDGADISSLDDENLAVITVVVTDERPAFYLYCRATSDRNLLDVVHYVARLSG